MNDILAQINSYLIDKEKYSLLEVVSGENDSSLVNELFDFLYKREIITTADYRSFIELIEKFIENFEDQNISPSRKFDIRDENKSLIRYCFFLLQKAQPKSRGTKKYFIKFMQEVFINYENDKSLSNHFSEPPIELLDWYPDKVKEAMRKDT
ncbi:hypothetical protein [uncultured Draconibacterium sp.]|uniref:hypothetical protein n=1 Tax=uncultured Draconibacterium sp. TaxID=1573823 RepID=UPI002AA80807|nr:hypothetical protein [uncultured Draconibacterium sp.]